MAFRTSSRGPKARRSRPVEHQQEVAFLNGGGSVRHDHDGSPVLLHAADRGVQRHRAVIVEV